MRKYFHQLKWAVYLWSGVLLAGVILSPEIFADRLEVKKDLVRPSPFELEPLPPFPVQENLANLFLSAKSYASIDVASGEFLLGRATVDKLPPASTVKLMLSWLAVKRCPLDQVVTVKRDYQVGTILGLKAGERWSVESLLYGTLLPSANDAAVALAEGCFGSVEAAVSAMNERAGVWHLRQTRFTNPTGLDEEGNLSSASDLVRMAALVTTDPTISRIVRTTGRNISSADGSVTHQLNNTNKLLGVSGIDGIKTGQTELAGGNLIVSSKLNGHHVITAVLGSEDRFGDTLTLLTEIRRVYRWEVESDWNFGTTLGDTDTVK